MDPRSRHHQSHDDPTTDRGSLSVPSARPASDTHAAAARLVREQIDRLYDGDSKRQDQTSRTAVTGDTYDRTHSTEAVTLATAESAMKDSGASSWETYHTSWQNYYQQYYQRYYLQQLHAQRKRDAIMSPSTPAMVVSETAGGVGTGSGGGVTGDIRTELLDRIGSRAKALSRSNHFWPIVSAVAVGLIFLLIQYNRLLIGQINAYISPGAISSQNIILDPTADVKVGPEPRIVIPKINVDAPVVYGLQSLRESDVQNALRDGVVHYPYPGANSLPGQVGNAVMLGHTSNDVFDPGKYKFVFTLMERLVDGDTIYLHYNGIRYTYVVNKREVVNPNEINKLVVATDKPLVTLVGCVPIGTADQRLLITAEQVSPDPAKATQPTTSEPSTNQTPALPGTSETLFERLFN